MLLMSGLKARNLVIVVAATTLLSGCRNRQAVTTYHYDNSRSGWNSNEKELTYSKVGSPAFGLLHSVALDDQIDAQPLIVPKVKIAGGPDPGEHEVVYVASESNTIFAIGASTGTVLLSQNFGPPVPLPLGCTNNGPNVGINGTPVIDREDKTMYVIVYTLEAGSPAYRIHALDLRTLTDKVPPVKVAASHALKDGTIYNFDARYQRQRPGLLLADGNVYAGFGSFCDFRADVSRGWVLGWKAGSLAPLPANNVNDRLATSPDNFFLSSIWMSGYGLAADGSGSIYFITGNSDSSASTTTYDGVFNVQESVVKLSGDLSKVLDVFTPSNVGNLDQADNDFGSGGVLLLPEQSGSIPHLTAAAGKDGRMFVLNRDGLGGFTSGGPDKAIGMVNIGGCWCGQSYFQDHTDGLLRIVSSGGTNVNLWKVQTSPSFTITNVGSSPGMASGQDPGFFTSISSDGKKGKEAIVWAVSRPTNPSPANISLYAFKGEPSGGSLTQLFQATAGTWPNVGGNANIVPVVANGRVYVASNKQLTIFGLH
jgi:hypothetical protein